MASSTAHSRKSLCNQTSPRRGRTPRCGWRNEVLLREGFWRAVRQSGVAGGEGFLAWAAPGVVLGGAANGCARGERRLASGDDSLRSTLDRLDIARRPVSGDSASGGSVGGNGLPSARLFARLFRASACTPVRLHAVEAHSSRDAEKPASAGFPYHGSGWIRTNVDIRQRVYSPSPLASRAHSRHARPPRRPRADLSEESGAFSPWCRAGSGPPAAFRAS
jgi:hypothetical protein